MGSNHLPLMERYLESLPGGLDAYPEYVQKASVVKQFSTEMPTSLLVGHLPDELEPLISKNFPTSGWVSETWANAVLLAVRDVGYSSDDDFVAAAMRANRRLLNGPIYGLLLQVVSPCFLVRNLASRWAVFHQGIELSAVSNAPKEAQLRMSFPKRLIPPLITRAYATAFQCAIESAGGKSVWSQIISQDPIHSEFRVSWN